jgi:hypothetical protein
MQSISSDPTFAAPIPVPDGFTGATVTLPHTAGTTLYLRLRDDPTATDSATLPAPATPVQTQKPGSRRASAIPHTS